MEMKAAHKKYILNFIRPGGTSRGVLRTKETHFIKVTKADKIGYGECGLFRGLSCDDLPDYENKLDWLCTNINSPVELLMEKLENYPSIRFGLEQALIAIQNRSPFDMFESNFTAGKQGIPINGLIWMGSPEFMETQIREKLKDGFTTIKMKIGAIDFDSELEILKGVRINYNKEEIVLRVDANGAFSPDDAMEKLKRLAEFDIHSIEQPIRQGQYEEMARLCEESPIPIALDEELIGVHDVTNKQKLLQIINPQYLILKPSLLGGFKSSDEWIDLAENQEVGWWVTSALESNLGLNAIAQWTFKKKNTRPQGLGTGALFNNNFESPLFVRDGQLLSDRSKGWKFNIWDSY